MWPNGTLTNAAPVDAAPGDAHFRLLHFPKNYPNPTSLPKNRFISSKDLLEILACPNCKGPVKLKDETAIVCEKCMLLYEIQDDIPVMLIDKAQKIEE